jgi:preprotein translocase subunit SecF
MITKNAINFMGEPHRRVLMFLSLILTIASLVSLATKGLKFGLDFTGGTSLELRYEQAPELKQVRETLISAGYPSAVVVNFGEPTDILVRVQSSEANNELGQVITDILRKSSARTSPLNSQNMWAPTWVRSY